MSYDSKKVSYPFLVVNHLAMMLILLKNRLSFNEEAEALIGMPIKIIPPDICPDNKHPIAKICRSPSVTEEYVI